MGVQEPQPFLGNHYHTPKEHKEWLRVLPHMAFLLHPLFRLAWKSPNLQPPSLTCVRYFSSTTSYFRGNLCLLHLWGMYSQMYLVECRLHIFPPFQPWQEYQSSAIFWTCKLLNTSWTEIPSPDMMPIRDLDGEHWFPIFLLCIVCVLCGSKRWYTASFKETSDTSGGWRGLAWPV